MESLGDEMHEAQCCVLGVHGRLWRASAEVRGTDH